MTRRSRTAPALALAVALTAVLTALLGTTGVAGAQDRPTHVRLAHLSPDTPPVDVTLVAVDDPEVRFTATGVAYGAVSDYRTLPTGTYTVSMRMAGAAPDSPPVIAATLPAGGGEAFTVAGTGPYAELGLEVLTDDLTMPAAGQARVRVVNAAAASGAVSVSGGPLDGLVVPFAGDTGYRTLPAGDHTLRVTPDGGPEQDVPLAVDANSVHTVFLLDGPGGVTAQVHRDAAGPGTVPLGSVATGFGGVAGALPFLLATAAALVVGGAAASRLRPGR